MKRVINRRKFIKKSTGVTLGTAIIPSSALLFETCNPFTAYSRPRYQIGCFTIKPKGDITDCNLRQDIYNAKLSGRMESHALLE
ncbi:MAG: hypothetical protein J7L96_03800 [Bacteroidales bacterium]|nr:hypothetical protein [Bacteroidales bacterium]